MRTLPLLALLASLAMLGATVDADEIYLPSKSPGSRANYYPFSATGGDWRYQLVIPPRPLGNQGFTITDIAFNPVQSGSFVSSLFEVRMGHTTSAVSNYFAVNLPNPTTVLSSTNYGWTCKASTWCPLGLTGTFDYDGTSGLTIEIRFKAGRKLGGFNGRCWYTAPAPHSRVGKSGIGAFDATSGTHWGKDGLAIRIDLVGARITASGLGRIGTTVSFDLRAPGDFGRPYRVGSSLGEGPIRIGSMRLPLFPDGLLALSTGGLAPGLFIDYAGRLNASGAGTAKVAIPDLAYLKGVKVYTGFLTLDPSKPWGVSQVASKNVMVEIS